MSPDTFEQTAVPEHMFGDAAAFLAPDMRVTLNFAGDGQPLSGTRGFSNCQYSECTGVEASTKAGAAISR
jgi:hypothetical protein